MALEAISLAVFKKLGIGVLESINFIVHLKTSIQCLLSGILLALKLLQHEFVSWPGEYHKLRKNQH